MLRYLSSAFWARPAIPGLGRIPLNALVVAGLAIVGFGEHALWLAGIGAETLYLYSLATNVRFQHWVDAQDVARVRSSVDASRAELVQGLTGSSRQRLAAVEQRVGKIESLYREAQHEDFLFDGNREALEKLTNIYLRLLVAQRNLNVMAAETNEAGLTSQIAKLQEELKQPTASKQLRDSKQATLAILNQRLINLQRRSESMAEIESDLTRIEAQIDLALEEASLKGKPTAITSDIGLVSQLLLEDSTIAPATTSTPELEN